MDTIIDLFEASVQRYPDNVFLSAHDGAQQCALSYSKVHEQVVRLASALQSLGLKPGDRAAILSENRIDWIITDLAILYCGGIVVTLSTKLIQDEDLTDRLSNSMPSILFVSKTQRQRLARVTMPETLRHSICFDDEAYRQCLSEPSQPLKPVTLHADDPAVIIYTSGTTGAPKGVVLSHHNNVAHVEKHRPLGDFTSASTTLALLPLDHCLFHAFYYMAMANGAQIVMPQQGNTPLEAMLHLMQDIREAQPDILVVVPAMLQTFRFLLQQQHAADDAGHARAFFGGRLRYFIAGGALTDDQTERFFMDLQLPIHIGYGMTEATAGISRSYPAQHRIGSIGRPASLQQEISIIDDAGRRCDVGESGEICYRGDTVMLGYWDNPQATAEVLTADGWLHTGDLGHFDADGYLYIDGRIKSLLIAASGEKYSPEGIEAAILRSSPCIHQIMLYNQQSPCTVALVVPDKAALRSQLSACGLSPDTAEGRHAAIDTIMAAISSFRPNGANAGLFAEVWLPATFALIDEPFTVANGMITATQKLVRHKIVECYRDRIASLFTPEGMNPTNQTFSL